MQKNKRRRNERKGKWKMMKTLFKTSSKKANKENRTRVKCKDQSELKGQQMMSGRGGQYIQHHDTDERLRNLCRQMNI